MKHHHAFLRSISDLAATCLSVLVVVSAYAQDSTADFPARMDSLLQEYLESPTSSEVSPQKKTDLSHEEPQVSEEAILPTPTYSSTQSSQKVTNEESEQRSEFNEKDAISTTPNLSTEFTATHVASETGDLDSTSNYLDKNQYVRLGAWLGYVTGSGNEGGYVGQLELDFPVSREDFFVSIRGVYLTVDQNDYTKTWEKVYGRYGHSFYSYTDKYGDVTENRYGASAVFLWNFHHEDKARFYGGLGGVYIKTSEDADVSRERQDHHSYGSYYGGSYRHSYYSTSRSNSSFHHDDSDDSCTLVLRTGMVSRLDDRHSLAVEASFMPELYDDGSEIEIRGLCDRKLSEKSSVNVTLEYLTDAKFLMICVGYSIGY